MNPAATILLTAAAVIWLAPLAVVAGCYVRDRLEDRAEQKLRAEEIRFETTPEWRAVMAAVEPEPIYDQLVCESIEKAEGWK